jgi:hypothetical protein
LQKKRYKFTSKHLFKYARVLSFLFPLAGMWFAQKASTSHGYTLPFGTALLRVMFVVNAVGMTAGQMVVAHDERVSKN